MLTGENGILTQAQRAKNETENAQIEEENILSDYENYLSQYTNGGYVESKGVNAPVLKDGMELVTYNEETEEWETNNSSSAYDYVAVEGTEDNNSSRWANARLTIEGVESYFVWIPRYAYKITYNNPDNISEGGTIDVKFLIGTTDQYYDDEGNIQTAKRAVTGHENTTRDYYVHPAFTNNIDLGGWSSELTGIWVGKYESSRSDSERTTQGISTRIKVQPGVTSWRSTTIGDMYTYAKAYSTNLNSHMLKNSEWGAVAYLTYSQYGKNGTEVTINNSSDCITGSAQTSEGTTNDYKSPDGVLASSTGNVTGIYDLSGGAYEVMATYYSESSSLPNGSSFADGSSDEYSTVYAITNEITDYKLGDATYETSGWNEDSANLLNSYTGFFSRGGDYYGSFITGVFCFDRSDGSAVTNVSFRMCLTVK